MLLAGDAIPVRIQAYIPLCSSCLEELVIRMLNALTERMHGTQSVHGNREGLLTCFPRRPSLALLIKDLSQHEQAFGENGMIRAKGRPLDGNGSFDHAPSIRQQVLCCEPLRQTHQRLSGWMVGFSVCTCAGSQSLLDQIPSRRKLLEPDQ